MEIYDPAKVGKRIAWGRSHSVFRYGDNEVIRFPRGELFFRMLLRDGLSLPERYAFDISVTERYFGDYALATRVVQDAGGRVATIQPYIRGHYLSKADLRNEPTKSQFHEFVKKYEAMVAAGYESDLIGQGGVLRRRLSNILVLPDGSLKLFDAKVIETAKIGKAALIARLIAMYALARQRSTLRYMLS